MSLGDDFALFGGTCVVVGAIVGAIALNYAFNSSADKTPSGEYQSLCTMTDSVAKQGLTTGQKLQADKNNNCVVVPK